MSNEIQKFGSCIGFTIPLNCEDAIEANIKNVTIFISTDGIDNSTAAIVFIQSIKEELKAKFAEMLEQPLSPVVEEIREVDITGAVCGLE